MAPPPCHLLVAIHGLHGFAWNFARMEKFLSARVGPSVMIHATRVNCPYGLGTFLSTTDGIEKGGQRIFDELEDLLSKNESIKTVSFLGNSLGGLYARHVVGQAYEKKVQGEPSVWTRVRMLHFIACVTPHLGILGNSAIIKFGAKLVTRRTGRELLLVDREGGDPLLLRMADPNSSFVKGLSEFMTRSCVGNLRGETSVPYHTACIVDWHPSNEYIYAQPEPGLGDGNLRRVIVDLPGVVPGDSSGQPINNPLVRKMSEGLRSVQWTRVEMCYCDGWFDHIPIVVHSAPVLGLPFMTRSSLLDWIAHHLPFPSPTEHPCAAPVDTTTPGEENPDIGGVKLELGSDETPK